VEITKNITKNSIRIGKLILLVFSFLLIYNCSTSSQNTSRRHKNLSYLYNEDEVFLHPQYQIYNSSIDSSIVFIKLSFSELLIKDLGEEFDKYSIVEIHYRLYESLTSGGLIDSASITKKLIVNEGEKEVIFSFPIRSPRYRKTFLNIRIKDLFSERSRKDYLEVDKYHSLNRQSFLIENNRTKEPLFGNDLLIGNVYHIQSPLFKKYPLYINEHDLIKSVPLPPDSKQREHSIDFFPNISYLSDNHEITPNGKYLSFLTIDSNTTKGVALFAYDSIPNYLHTPSQLLEPLSYLLSPTNYQIALQDTNPKYALDRFWLGVAGNVRHASEMIKVYYHRVDVANKYFSSYKQGWMTDRGMIYIIYGEPAKIYKSQTLERWIYGSMDSEKALTFDFDKVRNRFSDNNFRLVRSESYKQSWSQAVNSWLNGRIYSIAK